MHIHEAQDAQCGIKLSTPPSVIITLEFERWPSSILHNGHSQITVCQ